MYSIDTSFYDANGVEKTLTVYDDVAIDLRVKVIDPVLELEDNASGSLEMTVYQSNQAYGDLIDSVGSPLFLMSSTIHVYAKTPVVDPDSGEIISYAKEEIWEGRPLSDERDFYNAKAIRCEGAYAYLNDIDQPYKEYLGVNGARLEIIDFINGVLTEYNDKASPNRRFDVTKTYVNNICIPKVLHFKGEVSSVSNLPSSGNQENDLYKIENAEIYYAWRYTTGSVSTVLGWVDVTTSVYHTLGYSRKTGGEKTKSSIDALLEELGGHVKVVKINGNRCLYYTVNPIPEDDFVYAGAEHATPQKIKFGKNLLDMVRTRDGSEFFTVLLPVGAEISTSQPETIESMCTNVFTDTVERQSDHNFTQIRDAGQDVYNDPCVSPFDTTAVTSDALTDGPRRAIWVDMHSGNGYDYYLFTSASYCTDEVNDLPPQGNANLLFYHLVDVSPEYSTIRNLATVGYMDNTANYGVTYRNARTVSQKKLSKSQGRQTIIEKFSIPETGSYNLGFSVDTDLMFAIQNGDPNSYEVVPYDHIPQDYFGSSDQQHSLQYPRLYKSPYKNAVYQYTGVRKVPDSEIMWVGTLKDSHNESGIPADSQYAKYGGDDHDIFYNQGGGGYIELTNSAFKGHYLDQYGPFKNGYPLPTGWREMYTGSAWGGHPGWSFLTGYFGHHVGRVMVEPGKTYYLNTRITNKPYPDVPDECPYDPETGLYQDYFDIDGAPKKMIQNNIFAYAVIARRELRRTKNEPLQWVNQLVAFKLAGSGVITNELVMEKIKVPDALFPEEKVSWDDPNRDSEPHLELWFTCDNCYVNGCSNLTDTPREYDGPGPDIADYPTGYNISNPINGYRPSVYIEDATDTSGDSSEGTDYRKCVTVAPLNPQQPAGYSNFPREYLVNKELADRYGVIVKRVDYDKATTPRVLMEYADAIWSLNTTDPSLEVSAVDMKACGVENCDQLRWMQNVEVEDDAHGVNTAIVLSKMSINLADLSNNTYTLGYEANRGISSM